jgi:hypothetical protein
MGTLVRLHPVAVHPPATLRELHLIAGVRVRANTLLSHQPLDCALHVHRTFLVLPAECVASTGPAQLLAPVSSRQLSRARPSQMRRLIMLTRPTAPRLASLQ